MAEVAEMREDGDAAERLGDLTCVGVTWDCSVICERRCDSEVCIGGLYLEEGFF